MRWCGGAEYAGAGAAHAAPFASEGVGVYGEGFGGAASVGFTGLSVSGVPQTSSASAEAEMALVGEGEQQVVQDARANSTPAAPASGACVSFTRFTAALYANSTLAAPAAGACVRFARVTSGR